MANIGTLVVDLKADVARFSSDLAKARGDLAKVGASVGNVDKQLAGFGRGLRSALGAIGISIGVREVIAYADAWTEVGNRIRIATGDATRAQAVQGRLYRIAQQQGSALSPLVELYQRASLAQKDLNATEDELISFTEGVAKALRVQGTSTQAASGALLQLGQSLGGTLVQAQEFNSLIDGAPRLLKAAADGIEGMDGSIGKLRKAVLAQKVTNEDFFRGMLIGFRGLDDEVASSSQTFGQAFTRLDNAIGRVIGTQGEATGATGLLIGAINDLADALDNPTAKMKVFGAATDEEFRDLGEKTRAFETFAKTVADGLRDIAGAAIAADAELLAFLKSLPGMPSTVGVLGRTMPVEELGKGGVSILGHPFTIGGGTGGTPLTIGIGPGGIKGPPSGGLPSMLPSWSTTPFEPTAGGLVTLTGTGKGTGGKGKTPEDVIKALRFEIEQLGRTAREQDIFKALQTAGVEFGSATGQTIAALVDQLHKLKLGQDAANEAFKRGAEQAAEQDRQRAEASERARAILDERNALVAGFDLELKNREALLAALRDSAAAYEVEARFQEMAQQFRAMGMPLYGEEIANVRALAEQFAALDKQTEGITKLRGELASVADTINNDLSQSVADLVGGVKTLDDVWKQLTVTIVKGLLDIAQASLFPSTGSSGGGIGGLVADFFGGLFGGSFFGGGGSAPVFGGLYAEGGKIGAGEWGIVGERGPEPVLGPATVLPNSVLDGMGRGGMSVKIDARGATRDMVPFLIEELQRLDARVDSVDRSIETRSINATLNAKQRSSSYKRALTR